MESSNSSPWEKERADARGTQTVAATVLDQVESITRYRSVLRDYSPLFAMVESLAVPPVRPHLPRMRTTSDDASVRLYHLSDGDDGGGASTLFYGPLGEAMAIAQAQPAEVQAGLFLATENDVVAYLDLVED